MTASSPNILGQLLLPLRGMVNFFSPPAPLPSRTRFEAAHHPAPSFPSAQLMQSAAALTSGSAQAQPAGIRLVGQGLMGQRPGNLCAAQILRSRRAQDGRIVISGRMRDVCAELDRLCEGAA